LPASTQWEVGAAAAGENLASVLARRAQELGPPVQMGDALSRNLPKLPEKLEVIVSHCLAHYPDNGIIQSLSGGLSVDGPRRGEATAECSR
jgi:hypothetical protein